MQADFHDAHERHWDDAERLLQARRWANADHLYGMAAECGLKRLMLCFGMNFDLVRNRPSDPQDQKHANLIWERFETYRSGHFQGTGYTLSLPNPFQNWVAEQRYANQSNFDQTLALAHRRGASEVRNLVKQGLRDGLI